MPQRCSLGCGPSTECGRRRSFNLIGRPFAGGLDVADRHVQEEPGDHQTLERVGAGHARADQPRGERLAASTG